MKPTKKKPAKRTHKYKAIGWLNEYSWGLSLWGHTSKKRAMESKDSEHYLRTVRVYVRET